MASAPPPPNGITISFTNLSPWFRNLLAGLLLVGATGGGWHIIAQTVGGGNAAYAKEHQQRLHKIETKALESAADLRIALHDLKECDTRLDGRLDRIERRLDALTQLIAANYVAAITGGLDPKAAKIIAEQVSSNPTAPLPVP